MGAITSSKKIHAAKDQHPCQHLRVDLKKLASDNRREVPWGRGVVTGHSYMKTEGKMSRAPSGSRVTHTIDDASSFQKKCSVDFKQYHQKNGN